MSVPPDYAKQFKARQAAKEAAEVERQAGPPMSRKQAKPAMPADASRWATLNSFVDVAMGDLSRAELAVWLVLYRDVRNGTASTGMADIARRAGCSKRAVVTATNALAVRGLVRVIRRGKLNQGASIYAVCAVPQPSSAVRKPK